MLYGAGNLVVRTLDRPTNMGQVVLPLCAAKFELTIDTKAAEAYCLIDGKRQITAAAVAETTAKMMLSFERTDWQTMEFLYDEVGSITDNANVSVLKSAVVPTSTPYEIVDAALTASNAASVSVFRASSGASLDRGYLDRSASAPADASHYQLDTTATGKLIFNAANAGQTIQYTVGIPYTDIPTIGVESNPNRFGNIEFWGRVYNTEFIEPLVIHVPLIYRTSSPSIKVEGGVSTFDLELRAAVPQGKNAPFALYNVGRAA